MKDHACCIPVDKKILFWAGGGGSGELAVYMMAVGISKSFIQMYYAPPKYTSLKLCSPKTLASKSPTQKYSRLKYLNNDLFNQTDSSNT